ncbi:hypothetical protein F4804DRAFT_83451 [Jackrogersella minutella]|nr:hypothetical protein F4804DRAFT_83451 [Jackrogersella minutella]
MANPNNPTTTFADSDSGYSSRTTTYPAPARTSQASVSSRTWIFGKTANQGRTLKPPDPAALRDSVAYPSGSEFEDTIEMGTAKTGRRVPSKPRLVDLGGRLRTKIKRKRKKMRESMAGFCCLAMCRSWAVGGPGGSWMA